ncbi:unnamed protein product [Heligmosomoides polygyrus]|uniref:Retrovirus-related Pol polyprotein from transposon TNT 1-94 n=1 Tax=Heligmosomoides polygyrus TaxID=6339 RepID=A0A3P8G3D8_HELPZ|nr:unnamed protein product [Heligmosomoides polygyrus]
MFLENMNLERQVQAWCDRLVRFGLKLNVKKTEYLTTDVNESSSIKIDGAELALTSVFKYLGSAIASDGGLMTEVNSRVDESEAQRQYVALQYFDGLRNDDVLKMSFNLRQDSKDVLQMSSIVRWDSEDVLKASSNVRRDSEDVPQTSNCARIPNKGN